MVETTGRLLIVDDQPDSITLLLAFLRGTEFDILVALDGEDGIEKARRGRPDLILLDIAMPAMDGLSVCERLKADPLTNRIPVIFLTGRVSLEDRLRGFSAGAVDYITKPFSEAEVLARITVHMQTKQRLECLESVAGLRALESVEEPLGRDDLLFAKTVDLLEKRLSEPPGLQDLLQELGVTERRLNQLFRRKVGLTVFDYFTELRLEIARHLLESSRLQVQAIASQVGYRNAGDFTRAFRRRYGTSPRQYRNGLGVPDDET